MIGKKELSVIPAIFDGRDEEAPKNKGSPLSSYRLGPATLLAASEEIKFDVVLVDDLSRLARDNYLFLSLMADLHLDGVRLVSVAAGFDPGDEEAKLGIQIRGITVAEAPSDCQVIVKKVPASTDYQGTQWKVTEDQIPMQDVLIGTSAYCADPV